MASYLKDMKVATGAYITFTAKLDRDAEFQGIETAGRKVVTLRIGRSILKHVEPEMAKIPHLETAGIEGGSYIVELKVYPTIVLDDFVGRNGVRLLLCADALRDAIKVAGIDVVAEDIGEQILYAKDHLWDGIMKATHAGE